MWRNTIAVYNKNNNNNNTETHLFIYVLFWDILPPYPNFVMFKIKSILGNLFNPRTFGNFSLKKQRGRDFSGGALYISIDLNLPVTILMQIKTW